MPGLAAGLGWDLVVEKEKEKRKDPGSPFANSFLEESALCTKKKKT